MKPDSEPTFLNRGFRSFLLYLFVFSILFNCEYRPKDDQNLLLLLGTGTSSSNSSQGGIDDPTSNPPASTPIGGWTNDAYIKPPNVGLGGLYFGYNLAISGDTMVVGAYRESSNQTTITNGPTASMDTSFMDSGAAYVFRNVSGNWIQEAYLKASNANTNDRFGISVAISGDTIVVGATLDGSSGSAYVFQRTGTTWVQEAMLKASNFDMGDQFGSDVAIDGDVIVVGAQWEDSNQSTITNGTTASVNNGRNDSGAAYVFRRNTGVWTQEAYLKASNSDSGDYFGSSVSISGDTIAIGAYQESSQSVSINGGIASGDNSKFASGAVYVYRRSAGIWAEEAFLKASNLDTSDRFGFSVAIVGNTIVVGSPLEDSNENTVVNGSTASSDNSNGSAGAAYVFARNGTVWTQQAYVKTPNVQGGDQFGTSVAIDGDRILIGAINEGSNQTTVTNGILNDWNDQAPQSGAAYLFQKVSGVWEMEAYFKAPNPDVADLFGISVAISGNRIAIGASQECSNQTTISSGSTASADNSAYRSGAAYAFRK
ncbi:FG-GAP repeat protein [Leptospira sanjuanensis]|uniref:FG-GAP repeat protein n=1 Tax=Leptospira sanjuanensis TaxID=2879643 RepID=UPI001EE7D2D9|nr:FG-GAP repeat protein [Leptospira sanjuanensis]MCG6167708.1 FG-GAP repeat protein [Leptospira sanjuanensis]